MNLQELLADEPVIHRDEQKNLVIYPLHTEALNLIDAVVGPDSCTLETGAGLSTILFAIKGARHVCVTPIEEEVRLIKDYCSEHHVSTDSVRFEIGYSEETLPRLKLERIDLGLIDGRHGFPTPFIDWHYAAAALRPGGTLIVDDTQIWTVGVLMDFLVEDPNWRLDHHYGGRTAVFTKLEDVYHYAEWINQPYVTRRSSELLPPQPSPWTLLRHGHPRSAWRSLHTRSGHPAVRG